MATQPQLCKDCQERPVLIKKTQQCRLCYQRQRKKDIRKGRPIVRGHVHHDCEFRFIQEFFKEDTKWRHECVRFLANGHYYTPDFYDLERDVFIEVCGTRQAFHENVKKYKEVVRAYPKIQFEFRHPDGRLIDLKHPGGWSNTNTKET